MNPAFFRKSIRLRGYDYASDGAYFVTMCINQRRTHLGSIEDGAFSPTIAGQMVESWWCGIPLKFPTVEMDSYVVMPNHFHGILAIRSRDGGKHGGLPLQNAVSLPRTMQWFKSITTHDYTLGVRKYGFPEFDKRFWQKNYYEHIIRSDEELNRIRYYIESNIVNWHLDPENIL